MQLASERGRLALLTPVEQNGCRFSRPPRLCLIRPLSRIHLRHVHRHGRHQCCQGRCLHHYHLARRQTWAARHTPLASYLDQMQTPMLFSHLDCYYSRDYPSSCHQGCPLRNFEIPTAPPGTMEMRKYPQFQLFQRLMTLQKSYLRKLHSTINASQACLLMPVV